MWRPHVLEDLPLRGLPSCKCESYMKAMFESFCEKKKKKKKKKNEKKKKNWGKRIFLANALKYPLEVTAHT